ncbi:GNAT family N-acetyltransferase [Ruegeria marina]|uniref:Acetyltransferase (GNAT) domain-containing protein n=1 Tax=Ruegeria marina TaxID=639004 RepID=A0A1G6UP18_9RHOB|nr:GNAT family N-acetyltransferase [Ruegeria marina]SDD43033.1 Acetyltransferase (GNAT) domain-containing protein [Ruegeria marina]
MQNKRGISQAFSPASTEHRLRPATPFDVFEMSGVLIRSISSLCATDHRNDPEAVSRWCADKSPQALRDRMAAGDTEYWVSILSGRIAAVGALSDVGDEPGTGRIVLNYVDPAFRNQGVSSNMLDRLEALLAERRVSRALLTSTATARDFYLRRGWQMAGPPRQGRWILGHPLEKTLPAGTG